MIYVMSDIHGCYEKYAAMLKKIKLSDADTLYILGDVLDCGPRGLKILLDIATDRSDKMDNQLKELYREMLSIKMKNGKTIYDRITPSDLCLAGHRVGRLYDGILIYGQAMNGWQNEENQDVDGLINEIEIGSQNYKELYTIVDYNGWHGYTNGKTDKYHYKTSKFWKLNYLVITNAQDTNLDHFYIDQPKNEDKRKEAFDNAWSQKLAWSNLYKVSYSEGGNPDDKIIEAIKEISLKIILREIELLKPNCVLFNTGENLFSCVALEQGNVFGLKKVNEEGNVLYKGEYEYLSGEKCKIVVCKRPDVRNLYYTNADIVNEAKEILEAFDSI